MPTFTIELSYRVPVFRHVTIEADSTEEACRIAMEDEDWDDGQVDYESAGATYVRGAWTGSEAYGLEAALDLPSTYGGEPP